MKDRFYSLWILVCIAILLLLNISCNKNHTKDPRYETNVIEDILNGIALPNISNRSYRITDFGAIADGKYDCKPLIDSIINMVSSAGGGKIIFPKGKYYCKGAIHLQSYIHLHLEEKAVLFFSKDPKDYLPLEFVRWEGVEMYNYSPYIYAFNKTNIAITGKGKFNGNAKGGIAGWKTLQDSAKQRLRAMGRQLVPVNERIFGIGSYLRPSFIQFMHCKNILIQGITIENVPFWVIHPTYCKNVTIENLHINSMSINNDGIDLDSSEDVLVENCVFNTGDDAIAIKSGRDNDGWRINRPSKNIVIRNCLAENTLHGMAFGSEVSGGIENVFVQNFVMKNVRQMALQFKSNKDRGGYIKNISIEGMFVDTASTAILFSNNYHGYSGGEYPSEFNRIYIGNVICNKIYNNAIMVLGLEEQPIHNVTFENILVMNEKGKAVFQNVKNYKLYNVRTITDQMLKSSIE